MIDQQEQLRKAVLFYHILTSDEINGRFDLTATAKLNQHSILRELVPVLKKGEVFILEEALDLVRNYVDGLMVMTDDELMFIKNFRSGIYSPELLFDDPDIIDRISCHPMAKWKSSKLKE